MLVFWSLASLVRNNAGLTVYLLFSVVCFFTVHEHSRPIVIAVALHEVDNAPDTKPGSQSYNKCLQNAYCQIKKCHEFLLSCRVCGCPKKGIKKRRSVLVTAAVISLSGWAGSPRRLRVCGAAVFSCKGGGSYSALTSCICATSPPLSG